MINEAPFEIITADALRFRCDKSGYRWQYGLVSGTIDVEDKTVVEVLFIDENSEDEAELIKTFSQVVAVGSVTDEISMRVSVEKTLAKCRRCGYIEYEK